MKHNDAPVDKKADEGVGGRSYNPYPTVGMTHEEKLSYCFSQYPLLSALAIVTMTLVGCGIGYVIINIVFPWLGGS